MSNSKPLVDYMIQMESLMDEVAQTFKPQEIRPFILALDQKKEWILWEYVVGRG